MIIGRTCQNRFHLITEDRQFLCVMRYIYITIHLILTNVPRIAQQTQIKFTDKYARIFRISNQMLKYQHNN